MSKESDAKDKEFRRDSYWNKERLAAHAAPHLEFNPEKKPWVGLTGAEVNHICAAYVGYPERMMREVEKLLKEKNNG